MIVSFHKQTKRNMNCLKELEELITNPRKLSKLVLNHIINRFKHIINHIINRFFFLYLAQMVNHNHRSQICSHVDCHDHNDHHDLITIILMILITLHNHDNDHQDDIQRWVAFPPKHCDGQRKQVQPILPRRSRSSSLASASSSSLSSSASSSLLSLLSLSMSSSSLTLRLLSCTITVSFRSFKD